MFGTNPIAAIFPRRNSAPTIVDLSLTEVVRGKIMLYAKEGKSIPLGWALDQDGQPTSDPQKALVGSLTAAGGMKGTMLALIVEVLCCGLTGASLSVNNDSYFAPGRKPVIGHAFMAIDPEAISGSDLYYSRVEELIERMLAEDGVRLPGARRQQATAQAQTNGIEISEALYQELLQFSK